MRRGGPLAVGGAASWTSGEQDVLTLLDVLAPREAWARWMWPLPCGWNWQVWDGTPPLALALALALTNWQVWDGTLLTLTLLPCGWNWQMWDGTPPLTL
jgi:hypothetical protein